VQSSAARDSAASAGDGNARADISKLSASELEDLILSHFLRADIDRNGYLDPKEFADVSLPALGPL
jgi:hypothetical protein